MNYRSILTGTLTIAVLVGVAFGLVWFLRRDLGNQTKQESSTIAAEAPPSQFATVKDVVDAITIVLDNGQMVRYIGVRPPETRSIIQCFGKEALLVNESIIGEKVRLEEDPVLPRSKDGAWVRYVFAQKDPAEAEEEERKAKEEAAKTPPEKGPAIPGMPFEGELNQSGQPEVSVAPEPEYMKYDDYMVNERILEAGFGFPVLSPEVKYYDRLTSALRYGSATKKGLWGACEVSNADNGMLMTQKIEECAVKATVISSGEKIYRVPECPSYAGAAVLSYKGGEWFCSEEEAVSAGFKKAADCL